MMLINNTWFWLNCTKASYSPLSLFTSCSLVPQEKIRQAKNKMRPAPVIILSFSFFVSIFPVSSRAVIFTFVSHNQHIASPSISSNNIIMILSMRTFRVWLLLVIHILTRLNLIFCLVDARFKFNECKHFNGLPSGLPSKHHHLYIKYLGRLVT